jgi:hypothetical protein
MSAVKRVESVSDIVLSIHAPTEDKIDDAKDSFYKELECASDKFPKCHIKILLGDFSAKVGSDNIFKQTIGDDSLHQINNDNGVRVVNFLHPIISLAEVQHFCIVTFINSRAYPLKERHNQIEHILIDRR